jgi:hypothetical protein
VFFNGFNETDSKNYVYELHLDSGCDDDNYYDGYNNDDDDVDDDDNGEANEYNSDCDL